MNEEVLVNDRVKFANGKTGRITSEPLIDNITTEHAQYGLGHWAGVELIERNAEPQIKVV